MVLSKNNTSFHILTYHKIEETSQFTKQLLYLSKNYHFINAVQLLDFFNKGVALPLNSILITFDDGDRSLYNNAFPILKKYKIPAIIFVVTNLINTKKPFWWDEIKYYLGEQEGEKRVWEVKQVSNREREEFLNNVRQSCGKPKMEETQLTTAELQEMHSSGITIANHSHTHPMFDRCDTKELEEEIECSMRVLKDLEFSSDIFAYPNGNYSETSEKILEEHNIKLAFLFDHKINKKNVNPMRISRLSVNDSTPLWKFKFILSGWHSNILPFTKALGKIGK